VENSRRGERAGSRGGLSADQPTRRSRPTCIGRLKPAPPGPTCSPKDARVVASMVSSMKWSAKVGLIMLLVRATRHQEPTRDRALPQDIVEQSKDGGESIVLAAASRSLGFGP
jgi:hypothetical protein